MGFAAARQTTKRIISLKGIPYFRTKDHDDHQFTQELYDFYNSLISEESRKQFRYTLDRMLQEFFQHIVDQITDRAQRQWDGFKLRTLALCIPNTWSKREKRVQDYLSSILDAVGVGFAETTFIFEAQAQAQYIIYKHPFELKGYTYLVTLDFGGHSMVCLLHDSILYPRRN